MTLIIHHPLSRIQSVAAPLAALDVDSIKRLVNAAARFRGLKCVTAHDIVLHRAWRAGATRMDSTPLQDGITGTGLEKQGGAC